MNQFQYTRTTETAAAVKLLAKEPAAQLLAGGTNLIDLMKMGIVVPQRLVDINQLPLKSIEKLGGGLRIGALATNTDVAESPLVKQYFPLLALAINAGASPQLRNMATVGGNMMQRTRCPYFFDLMMPCNKRAPGTGCSALAGYNRMHAVFGASNKCIAVNPSDMNVALTALDADVDISGAKGSRKIKFADFHRLPGDQPELDNNLQKTEIITAIELPFSPFTKQVDYLKVRDRSSYAFALVSVAAGLQIENNRITRAALAMGGLAHKPWRLKTAEAFLQGKMASEAIFKQAAAVAMEGAKAYEHNKFKLKLAPNAILQALKTAAATA
ncbi:MAG: xanthine dehydrogenase family protein subunit M [Chitinophagaceae bacterium]